jgi:dipeptidyl aminopeptidase/acylaminoacyl peptidase
MKRRGIRADDFLKLTFVSSIDLAPKGDQFVYTVKRIDGKKNKYYTDLFVCSSDGKRNVQYTHGDWNDVSPQWSPDGKWIAFFSDRGGMMNLYVVPTTGGEARKITDLKGMITYLSWMPNSRQLVFCFCPADIQAPSEELPKPPLVREIRRMYYKADGKGYVPKGKFHVFKVNVGSGRLKQLTNGVYDDGFPSPSPDGTKIAFVSNRQKDDEYNLMLFDLYIVDANGKRTIKRNTPKGLKHTLSWSPDGTSIAYVGNDKYLDYTGASNHNLWIIPAKGGRAKNLTAHFDRTVTNVCVDDIGETFGSVVPLWTADGKEILFGASDEGNHHLFSITIKHRTIKRITTEDMQLFDYSYHAPSERIAYTYSLPTSPAHIAVIKRTHTRPSFTKDINARILKGLRIATPKKLSWKGARGDTVHGWLLKPPFVRNGKKYPLIVEIHGGPHAQYPGTYFHEFQTLASAGYVVFYSNPHGSQGYGEGFARELVNRWGIPDSKDILNALKVLARKRFIDSKRIGVTGGSYGGFMTNWLIGHSNLFKAAVTQRCVSNMISMVGTSDFGFSMTREFGGPWWKKLDDYWKMSPLKYVTKMKTPLLIIHSENDMRTPIEQAEQLYIALKLQKKEVAFIRYPEESHGLSRTGRPDRRIHRLKKITGWFDKYLKKH